MASLSETINHLLKTVKNHIGRGGNAAHLPVDNDISGFMTPEMLKKLNESSGSLAPSNTDNFFTLPAGTYCLVGTETNNAPMSSGYHIVQVYDFLSRKMIQCMHMHTGVIYVYSYNRDDGSDETPMSMRGWRTITQRVTLATARVSEVDTPIVLNDSLDRYSSVIIYYNVDVSGITSTTEISVASLRRGVVPFSAINIANGANDSGVVVSECDISAKDSPNEIKIIRQKAVRLASDGSRSIISSDKIGIFRVVGIR